MTAWRAEQNRLALANEIAVLEAEDALDPADHSLRARQIRETADEIRNSPSPEQRDRIIWGDDE